MRFFGILFFLVNIPGVAYGEGIKAKKNCLLALTDTVGVDGASEIFGSAVVSHFNEKDKVWELWSFNDRSAHHVSLRGSDPVDFKVKVSNGQTAIATFDPRSRSFPGKLDLSVEPGKTLDLDKADLDNPKGEKILSEAIRSFFSQSEDSLRNLLVTTQEKLKKRSSSQESKAQIEGKVMKRLDNIYSECNQIKDADVSELVQKYYRSFGHRFANTSSTKRPDVSSTDAVHE